MNVAFVAVGRRVELVRAFRRALKSLGLDGQLVGIDVDPLAPAMQVCDRTYIVPKLNESGFVPALLDICSGEEVGLVFPLIDPVIEILAEHRLDLERGGARLCAVSAASARLAGDKLLLSSFFRGLGLSTPLSWTPEEVDPAQVSYPLFIKPRRGSASRDTYKIKNAEELEFFSKYITEPIIQEYIPGPEITNDVICDLEGSVLGVVSRRRIEVRAGEVSKGVTIYDAGIHDACVRIAKAFPAVGPVTIQCLMRGQEPFFTEINARLGGGVPLAVAAGFDVPGVLLSSVANLPFIVPEPGSYRTGMHMTRYDESFFLTAKEAGGIRAKSWTMGKQKRTRKSAKRI